MSLFDKHYEVTLKKPATELRDYHDVPFPEGTQPATGEWTSQSVKVLYGDLAVPDGWQVVADAHNAALAAEREKADNLFKVARKHCVENQELKQQLAAERENLERERMCHAACGVIAMSNTPEALAKNREMKPEYLSASVQDCIRAVERELQLRSQVAAAQAAMKEALLPIAVWKLTDESEPYREIGPDLRNGFLKAHDLLMPALLGGTTALDAAKAEAVEPVRKPVGASWHDKEMRQLSSQLAEVEEHNIRGAIHPDALAKHIAEAQQSLVDALRDAIGHSDGWRAKAAAALAKVKEVK